MIGKQMITMLADYVVSVVTDPKSKPSDFVDLPPEFDHWWHFDRRSGYVSFEGAMVIPYVMDRYLQDHNIKLLRKEKGFNQLEVTLVIANLINNENTARFRRQFRSTELLLNDIVRELKEH